MSTNPIEVQPYSILAAGYDVVMEHVDYESWAEYVDHLMQMHGHGDAKSRILEIGCGTGSLALVLAGIGHENIRGTDRSAEMIAVAQRKAAEEDADVRFEVEDFTAPASDAKVDVLLLLYDGLNYVLEQENLAALFRASRERLAPGGIFIFDQSTPSNSINNEAYFEDEGEEGDFRYVRKSRYDAGTRMHTTSLEIEVDGRRFRETHVQRAYDRAEIEPLVRDAGFRVLAAYDGFSLDEANEESERIHWVVTPADHD